jgi:hypothetical protein
VKRHIDIRAGIAGDRRRRRAQMLAAVGLLACAGAVSSTGLATAASSTRCSGTPSKPGTLTGSITGNVVVSGACAVNAGNATVHGSITVSAGGAFLATSAKDDTTHSGTSILHVTGNVIIDKGAAADLGCFATSSPCQDDPNQKHPTLNGPVKIDGNLIATSPLGVLVHDGTIGGKVSETGGGGGVNCKPTGIFAAFKSPVFSDYEDTHVGHDLSISGFHSCWLGVLRVHIGGNMLLSGDKLADPDAIEVGSNVIAGNLACTGNTMVWDTSDTGNKLYPRVFKGNKVHGKRSGQCLKSSPTTKGGPTGAHPF